ncbi:hypothetical protein NOV72_02517 [Caballeronia novacaledonica]|uniref:4'-phosphopantetheinyl transferase n=1 Tax=Caballeronia novacaledonica TaxID=1544861 RepID=A0A2U3I5B4_9BURK|nr:hypothetical protein [Caballeronia novacaledonica]SPB15291.1 hypothetical protein NOV72_02517 [Caballeronia novacaledonica]
MPSTDRISPLHATDVPWRYHDLAKSRVRIHEPPAPGEVCLWLVPSEFRFASASNIGNWLTPAERKRARLHPNSALGRRFGVARATLRLVLSHMLDCEPDEVGVGDEPGERIVVAHPLAEGAIHADVAYSGIWIVIAVASARIGLGLTVETTGVRDAVAKKLMWDEAARIGRTRAAHGEAGDDASLQDWYALTLPMPGEICGVLVTEQPVASVQAFGWEKPFEAEDSRAAS